MIALFLTDKCRTKKLGPAAGDHQRGEYLSWLAYRPGVLEPAILSRRAGADGLFRAHYRPACVSQNDGKG